MKRQKISPHKSKRDFSYNAVKSHGKNNYVPMRGGIRL